MRCWRTARGDGSCAHRPTKHEEREREDANPPEEHHQPVPTKEQEQQNDEQPVAHFTLQMRAQPGLASRTVYSDSGAIVTRNLRM